MLNSDKIVQANADFYEENASDYEAFQWYFRNSYMQKFWQKEIDLIAAFFGSERFRVLDVGCGTGNLTKKFLSYNCEVDCMDVSQKMLDILKSGLKKEVLKNVDFMCTDLDSLIARPFRKYDVVVECSVLHHLLDYEEYLNKVSKILKPGGYVLVTREPVSRDELASSTFVSSIIDTFITIGQAMTINILRVLGRSIEKKAPDHSIAAYHYYKDGVSFRKIMKQSRYKYEIINHKTYNRRFVSIFSFLENSLLGKFRRERFQYTFFSTILRKQEK